MSLFTLDLADGYDLVLADDTTADALHALTIENLDRLAPWEQWARSEQDPDESRKYIRDNLTAYAQGKMLPCVIRHEQRPVGVLSLRIDTDRAVGELGYWIASEHQGRGAVTRAATAVLDYGFHDLKLARIEIHTAAHNERSRAVAERLGFELEGTLRSAQPVGDERHDVLIYGKLATPE